MFSFLDGQPSVPVFDKTLQIKQMNVLEALDLLIARTDKGRRGPCSWILCVSGYICLMTIVSHLEGLYVHEICDFFSEVVFTR